MSLSIELLQELEPTEEFGLEDCCWNTLTRNCPWLGTLWMTTCHSCTNTK